MLLLAIKSLNMFRPSLLGPWLSKSIGWLATQKFILKLSQPVCQFHSFWDCWMVRLNLSSRLKYLRHPWSRFEINRVKLSTLVLNLLICVPLLIIYLMHSSFQFHDDMDDLDYGDEEGRNFDNDRTENHVQNIKKLNYHSYMNKQTRGKWSKSDTDVFYQVFIL